MKTLGVCEGKGLRIAGVIWFVILVTYVSTIPMQIDHYMRAILRGHYVRYYLIFGPVYALIAWSSIWVLGKRLSMPKQFILLMLLSYVSSLVAFFFVPTWMPPRHLFSFQGVDGAFFLSPLVSLSWLYGFSVGVAVWIASRRNHFLCR